MIDNVHGDKDKTPPPSGSVKMQYDMLCIVPGHYPEILRRLHLKNSEKIIRRPRFKLAICSSEFVKNFGSLPMSFFIFRKIVNC